MEDVRKLVVFYTDCNGDSKVQASAVNVWLNFMSLQNSLRSVEFEKSHASFLRTHLLREI